MTTNIPMSDLMRDSENRTGQIRFGVFFDGGWFSGLWRYLAESSRWHSAPTFLGVHDLIRWSLHRQGHPLDTITLDCAHYVLGRPDPGQGGGAGDFWDDVLARYGIIRHDARMVGGREKNADSLLQQVTYKHATNRELDVVALITGDGDMVPLVMRLVSHGFTVVVPTLPDIRYTHRTGHRWIRSSPRLAEAATHTPDWRDMLANAIRPDYPLAYPFTEPVPGAVSRPAADGYRYATVNRWHPDENYAFITDRGGVQWHVNRNVLPDPTLLLDLGQPVRFTGSPRRATGKKYPQARSIQPYQPHGPIP